MKKNLVKNNIQKIVIISNDYQTDDVLPKIDIIPFNFSKSKGLLNIINQKKLLSLLSIQKINILLSIDDFINFNEKNIVFEINNFNEKKQKAKVEKLNFLTKENELKFILPKINKEYSFDEKQQIIDGFSDGRFYFLANAINNSQVQIIQVLQAFSGFKKWQKSNMKLLLLNVNNILELKECLLSYKYKEDVVLIENVNEELEQKIIASAYCFIDASLSFDLPFYVQQAIELNVPVIVLQNEYVKSMYTNVAVSFATIQDLSTKMIELYKDETLRNNFIKNAKEELSNYSFEKTFEAINKVIEA